MNQSGALHGIIGPERSDVAEVVAYISGQKKLAISVIFCQAIVIQR